MRATHSENDSPNINYTPLRHSLLQFQGQLIHQADLAISLTFIIHLSPNTGNAQKMMEANQLLLAHPAKRKYLSHQELEELVGAPSDHVDQIEQYFKTFNIQIVNKNLLSRTLQLKGTVQDINRAFQILLHVYQGINQSTFIAYQGALFLPQELHPLVQQVSGITPLPKTEYRVPTYPEMNTNLEQKSANVQGYTAQQLAKAYHFPVGPKGKGQCVGIIELGGKFKKSDLTAYFKMMKLPQPKIVEVGTPINDDHTLSNSEVTLDIEILGTIVPGAKLVIYYGHTIFEAMQLVINDQKNKPSVVSISWAASEYAYTPVQIEQLNSVFYEASLLGITVIAACGDHGAFNGRPYLNVSIPSTHPLVVGCGGTNLTLTEEDQIKSEVVWNQNNGQVGSGGGFSSWFPLPNYQRLAVSQYPYFQGQSRGVPDLAASADETHGYLVLFNGQLIPIGGTSTATPLVAGLFVLLNESLGHRLGFVNNWLYQFAGIGFFAITQGNNGFFPAAPYWNPATGLGAPNGEKLLNLFQSTED
ncbi:MAG: S53 family peptidase [Bacteroidota bacterium]